MILHAPLPSLASTLEAWKALSVFVPASVRTLGISNLTLPILNALYEHTDIKPTVVQNRFHAATNYDTTIRAFCKENRILYEGFWVLTANESLLASAPVESLAQRAGVAKEVALYAMIIALGNTAVLNGTKNKQRMRLDLDGVKHVKDWATANQNTAEWHSLMQDFKQLLGEP